MSWGYNKSGEEATIEENAYEIGQSLKSGKLLWRVVGVV
jgi:hypothetical protein